MRFLIPAVHSPAASASIRRGRSRSALLLAIVLLIAGESRAQSGDLNGDGTTDHADLERGAQIAVGAPPTAAELEVGDLNHDGVLTVQDLVFIVRSITGLNRPPVADAGPDFEGTAGEPIMLDGASSFDLDGDALSYAWRQLHMGRYSGIYVTEAEAVFDDPTSPAPSFVPPWPGRYRLELRATDQDGLSDSDTIDVWVRADERALQAKGAIFADLFEQFGSPDFDVTPEDPDSLAAVQARAMQGPARVGADWIGITTSAFYSQVNPVPIIAPADNDVSLTNETDYAAIVFAAHARGLKVLQQESVTAGLLPLRPGEADSLAWLKENSSDWWDAWFDAFEAYLLPRVDRAERYEVEMFSLYAFADDTFRPEVYPEYDEHWRDLIAKVRTHYSGLVTVNVIATVNLTFADALDVVLATIFPLLYTTSDAFSDVKNPTLEEIRTRSLDLFGGLRYPIGDTVPLYVVFLSVSADGQATSEPPPPIEELDLREQVLYYEGFFQAVAEDPGINGVFSERWNWFEEQDFPGIYVDEMTGTSPRGKPSEDVIRWWFGQFSP